MSLFLSAAEQSMCHIENKVSKVPEAYRLRCAAVGISLGLPFYTYHYEYQISAAIILAMSNTPVVPG